MIKDLNKFLSTKRFNLKNWKISNSPVMDDTHPYDKISHSHLSCCHKNVFAQENIYHIELQYKS